MGAAGASLSLAIDYSSADDISSLLLSQRDEHMFVMIFETEPVMHAALTCLSIMELNHVRMASSTLHMNETLMLHMQTLRFATYRAFRRIIHDDAVNARLWLMLDPLDMNKMAATSAYFAGSPVPPPRAWQTYEQNMHEFFQECQTQVMARNQAGWTMEEMRSGVIYRIDM